MELLYRKNIIFLIIVIVLAWSPSIATSQIDIQEIILRTDTVQQPYKKASSYLFLAEYFMQDQPDTAIVFAQKALDISFNIDDSSLICDAYKYLSVAHGGKMDCDLSESCFFIGLPFARNASDSASFLSDMGAVYTMCGNLQKAERCHTTARKIFTRINDKNNLARLITNMGVMHTRTAHYYQASSCYLEALAICEEVNDEESIAVIYQNMGQVMAVQNQYDKAVGYFNSSLNMFEKMNRRPAMAGVYLNLGQIYIEQKQWDVAKHYLNKSYVIDTALHLLNHESTALKLLGITYLRMDKLESAEKLITEALRIQNENGYSTLAGETMTNLAEIYFKQGKKSKALELLQQAEALARASRDDQLLANALSLKSTILAEQQQFEQAYTNLIQSNTIGDSIFNMEKSKSIMNLELAYQTEKKEKQIDELKFNDKLRKEQLQKRTAQLYLVIVSVVLLIVMLVFIFLNWRRKQQEENQNRERHFLLGRFDAEERAKDEIARELHDDIGSQLIGLTLQLQSSQKLNDSELSLLRKVYRDVRRLSHSLDEPIFSEITLQDKIRNYLSELKDHVVFKSHFIDDLNLDWKKIAGNLELQRNIYRIVQELVTNTIKHAKANEIEIQLLLDEDKLVLIYEDDGIGFSIDKKQFNLIFNTIRKRVDMFMGQIEINSRPSGGLFVLISIPVVRIK